MATRGPRGVLSAISAKAVPTAPTSPPWPTGRRSRHLRRRFASVQTGDWPDIICFCLVTVGLPWHQTKQRGISISTGWLGRTVSSRIKPSPNRDPDHSQTLCGSGPGTQPDPVRTSQSLTQTLRGDSEISQLPLVAVGSGPSASSIFLSRSAL